MKTTKKCAVCGSTFPARSGRQRYCCEACRTEAGRAGAARRNDILKAVRPMMEIRHQEYLTFSKAAALMGCSRQYVYKLVAAGRLKASRLSSRMALVRRADIELMLEASPYHRVLPDGASARRESPSSSLSQKGEMRERKTDIASEFYSRDEVISIYKISPSWLSTCARRHGIPVCRMAGKHYYDRRQIEEIFGTVADNDTVTEWLTVEEAGDLFGTSPSAIWKFVRRHRIPVRKEHGRVYYSKAHLAELRRTDLFTDERYCTMEEAQKAYGLTYAVLYRIIRTCPVEKTKVGMKYMLLRSDLERVMAERAEQP
ncbi:MAG: helix-turn-helix domain-containing protein [Bacteroidales bacterium]|nr:helix-turn-helix domain-containing protein [Bacteroidales bacterium]